MITTRMVASAVGGAFLLYGYMSRDKEKGLLGTPAPNGETRLSLIIGAVALLAAILP